MPFKLVAVVESSISLGSILMIDGVHVMSIDTLTNKQMKEESVKEIQYLPKIEKAEKPKNPNMQRTKFHHPLGRTASDFVLEYLQQHKTGQWRELGKHVAEQGFAKSSINNGIQRLINQDKVKRIGVGIYAINPKKSSE